MEDRQFLGFDFSTQQIKAILLDHDLKLLRTFSIEFDSSLPEFRTSGGVHKSQDGLTVTAPTLMWVKALDLLLDKMWRDGVSFDKICALSGAGQQHGSVWWRLGSASKLENLDSNLSLHEQLKDAFSVPDAPVWMDSSTTKQCDQLEDRIGGALRLAEITGSRAHHRFTGSQIAKIFQELPAKYQATERISLVSSFACSLFAGKYAPIDWSDGSGMNLLDISNLKWHSDCLDICAPNLHQRLGDPVCSNTTVGKISPYFVKRFSFAADCEVVVFTGDNPSSMAGINQQKTDIAISLGTSDTVFVWMSSPRPSLSMHVLRNAVDDACFMGMLVFKNGALARERVRNEVGCQNWAEVDDLLAKCPKANHGNVGIYYFLHEILPDVPAGVHRFNAFDQQVDQFVAEVEMRAVIEGQALSKKVYAAQLGCEQVDRILLTGGASVNQTLSQVLADVFQCCVYAQQIPNSAALGAAYRAAHGDACPTSVGLGDDEWLQVFGCLPIEGLLACRAVCSNWCTLIRLDSLSTLHLHSLLYRDWRKSDSSCLQRRDARLHSVLERCGTNLKLLKLADLCDTFSIQSLTAKYFLSACAMRSIASCCPNLRRLDLSHHYFNSDELIDGLLCLPVGLKVLFFEKCRIELENDHHIDSADEFVCKLLNRFKALEMISLKASCFGTFVVSDVAFQNAPSTMRSIDLSACFTAKIMSLGFVIQFEQLTKLHLERAAIDDSDLLILSDRFKGCLTDLTLAYCKKVTGFEQIAAMTRLEHLRLDGNRDNLTDLALSQICQRCTALRSLRLENCCSLSANGLLPIAQLNELQLLSLNSVAALSDHCLQAIATDCPRLQRLYLKYCRNVTSCGLKQLCQLRFLTHLGVNAIKQFDLAALGHLLASTALQSVDAFECEQLLRQTAAGAEHSKALLSKLRCIRGAEALLAQPSIWWPNPTNPPSMLIANWKDDFDSCCRCWRKRRQANTLIIEVEVFQKHFQQLFSQMCGLS